MFRIFKRSFSYASPSFRGTKPRSDHRTEHKRPEYGIKKSPFGKGPFNGSKTFEKSTKATTYREYKNGNEKDKFADRKPMRRESTTNNLPFEGKSSKPYKPFSGKSLKYFNPTIYQDRSKKIDALDKTTKPFSAMQQFKPKNENNVRKGQEPVRKKESAESKMSSVETKSSFKETGKGGFSKYSRSSFAGLKYNPDFKHKLIKEKVARRREAAVTAFASTPSKFQLATLPKNLIPSSASTKTPSCFRGFPLTEELFEALKAVKIEKPTDIQGLSITRLVKEDGQFLIAGETGSGKTLAYLLPIFKRIKDKERIEKENGSYKPQMYSPKAVILVPSRELASQVLRTCKTLSHYEKMRCITLLVGMSKKEVDDLLNAPYDIIVTTPKRFLAFQSEGKIRLNQTSHLVVDEGDTLLSSDFAEELTPILSSAKPFLSQFIVATATISKAIHKTLLSDFPDIRIIASPNLHKPLFHLKHSFLQIKEGGQAKQKTALQVIQDEPGSTFIVFCNTIGATVSLQEYLSNEGGIDCHALHGNMTEEARESLIKLYNGIKHDNTPVSNPFKVLVCTDLGSRGLDTMRVNHVILYDFPHSLLDYIHRSGRTGRAGKGGKVTALVTKDDGNLAYLIQNSISTHTPLDHY